MDAGRSPTSSRPTRWLLVPALGLAALELLAAWLGPYERFHDEYYYWVGAQRLMFGYVDHPPLAPWLLAVSNALLGEGHLGFGAIPALCGAGTAWLTGFMAQRLGADVAGQLLAALAVAWSPIGLVFFSFYSVNAIEMLLWTAACCLLVELIRTRDERLWLAFGAVAGIALLNKHTFTVLAFGLAVGVLATPLRAQARSRWLWAGTALAIALASPNLVWNAVHGWPSWSFYTSRADSNLETRFLDSVVIQIAGIGPVQVLVWLPGALLLLFSKRLRPYRSLGIAFALLLAVILLSGQRRGDRIAGIYPIAFAAGATFWGGWRGRARPWICGAIGVLLVGVGGLLSMATLPIAKPETVAGFFRAIDESPEIEKTDAGQEIPLYLTGRIGWHSFADDLFAAWAALPPAERDRSVILTDHWVFAAALEFLARDRDLPPVVSPHNAYFFWRNDAVGRDAVVAVGIEPDALAQHFGEVEELGTLRCQLCAVFRPDMPILWATGPRIPLEALLTQWRTYSIETVPQLNGP